MFQLETHMATIEAIGLRKALHYYRDGLYDFAQEVALYQCLINHNLVWHLGIYEAKRARDLINQGYCVELAQYIHAGNPFLQKWDAEHGIINGGVK